MNMEKSINKIISNKGICNEDMCNKCFFQFEGMTPQTRQCVLESFSSIKRPDTRIWSPTIKNMSMEEWRVKASEHIIQTEKLKKMKEILK